MLKIYFDVAGNITGTVNASEAEEAEAAGFIVVTREGLPFSFSELTQTYRVANRALVLK